eukprot:g4567.t1
MKNWRERGLLDYVKERILFVQEIHINHCYDMERLTSHQVKVVGNVENVGIPNAKTFLIETATMPYLMVLERDYVTDDSADSVQAHLGFAVQSLHSNTSRSVVALRSWKRLRNGMIMHGDKRCLAEGSHLSSKVCTDDHNLRKAFETDFQNGTFNYEKCALSSSKERWSIPGLFYTTLSAMESCPERLMEIGKSDENAVTKCNDDPVAYCMLSSTSHWSGRPYLASKEFLVRHVLPYLPDCTKSLGSESKFCKYLGEESNDRLQCHLRSLNYTLVLTGGGFEHQVKCFSKDLSDCANGNGYIRTEKGMEFCETWHNNVF